MLIMSLAISVNLFADGTQPPGSGTEYSPYQVSTLDHLLWISTTSTSWDKHFIQTANIDASATSGWNEGAGFSPIGNWEYVNFTGSYNGDGHTIDGLFISRGSDSDIGLFGYINNSTIENLGATNVDVTGDRKTGGLVGYIINSCTISNCFSTGDVSVNRDYVGGLLGLGYSSCTIRNCYSTCNVTGVGVVGGLVGFNWNNSTVSNCYSTGSVSGSNNVGGLVGSNLNSTVNNSFWDTTTSGQSSSAGGTGKTTAEMTTDAHSYPNFYTDAGWDFKGESINGTDNIWNIGNSRNNGYPYFDWQYPSDPATLPVELSTFTVQYLNNTPTLYWETQSETDNLGWNVYRNEEENFSSAQKITDEMIQGNGTTSEPSYYSYNDTSEDIQIGQTYWYWLESIDLGGLTHYYDKAVTITIPDITQDPTYLEPPIVYELQSSPNPTKSSTHITFTLNKSVFAEVSIYNILGKLVKTLPMVVTTEDEKSTVYWNGKDENGNRLQAGVYLYKLLVNGKTAETKKLILMK